MRKLHLIATLSLALAAAPYSSAQQQVLPSHFSSWTCSPAAEDVEFDRIPNFSDLTKEAGLAENEVCDYFSGTAKIHVDLQKYRDPSSAYAISTADLVTLVNSVSAHADQAPLPPIRTYLPRGFSDGTQRYARGPAAFLNAIVSLKQGEFANLAGEAGFHSNAEAMLAHYQAGKDEAVLLLIEYPTPQLAEQHLRHLEQALSPAEKQAGTTIERKASLLSLVLKPSSVAYGNSLRSAVTYETEVTWNEPHQTVTDPPLLTTIAKIFLGTGLFMVVAVVLGVAFGVVRVLAKIFFPGKVFDRPEQMDVLQLGLSGKRINSRDFY